MRKGERKRETLDDRQSFWGDSPLKDTTERSGVLKFQRHRAEGFPLGWTSSLEGVQ